MLHITCEKCKSNYSINKKSLEDKTKFKCSNCNHIWDISNLKSHINELDNNIKNNSIPLFSIILIALVLFSSIVLIYTSNLKIYKDIYIQNVELEFNEDQKKVIAHYKIANKSDFSILLPVIRVRLLDQFNQTIKSQIIDKQIILENQQYVIFKTEFSKVPLNIKYLDITLGNNIDFLI